MRENSIEFMLIPAQGLRRCDIAAEEEAYVQWSAERPAIICRVVSSTPSKREFDRVHAYPDALCGDASPSHLDSNKKRKGWAAGKKIRRD